MRAFRGIVSLTLLASCQQPAELKAEQAWVRLPAVAGSPGAAYFTVHGGSETEILLSVSSPAALRAEMHQSMHQSMKDHHGMAGMQPIKDLAVPARTKLVFAPGGRHVMLFDLGPRVAAGQRIPLALAFASGKRLEVQALVVGAGDTEPGAELK